jgi:hypothetical protein
MILKGLNCEKVVIPLLFWLIALHSFIVGITLIFHPSEIKNTFSYKSMSENFFPIQGGVFFVLMAVLYALVALQWYQLRYLIYFSLTVKCMASIFLFSYYLFVEPIILVLICGFVDFSMAILIVLVLVKTVKGNTNIIKSKSPEKRPFALDRDQLLDKVTRLIDFF